MLSFCCIFNNGCRPSLLRYYRVPVTKGIRIRATARIESEMLRLLTVAVSPLNEKLVHLKQYNLNMKHSANNKKECTKSTTHCDIFVLDQRTRVSR
jgi:hypothetical protein